MVVKIFRGLPSRRMICWLPLRCVSTAVWGSDWGIFVKIFPTKLMNLPLVCFGSLLSFQRSYTPPSSFRMCCGQTGHCAWDQDSSQGTLPSFLSSRCVRRLNFDAIERPTSICRFWVKFFVIVTDNNFDTFSLQLRSKVVDDFQNSFFRKDKLMSISLCNDPGHFEPSEGNSKS